MALQKLFYLLAVVFIADKVTADDNNDGMPCLELFNLKTENSACCEDYDAVRSDMQDEHEHKECFEGITGNDDVCGSFQCFLEKENVFKDGVINEEAAGKSFDELNTKHSIDKSIIDAVKQECLGGKYEEYPPEELKCPALQFLVCVHLNMQINCKKWKKNDVCSKMADSAKRCKAAERSQ